MAMRSPPSCCSSSRGCSSILRLNGRRDSSPPRLALGALTFPFPIPSAMFLCCGVKGRGPEALEPSQGSKPATIPHQAKVSPKMLPPRPQRWRGYWPSRPHKPPTGDSRLPAGLCWTHTASTGLILRSQSWGPCKQRQTRGHCAFMLLGAEVLMQSLALSHIQQPMESQDRTTEHEPSHRGAGPFSLRGEGWGSWTLAW